MATFLWIRWPSTWVTPGRGPLAPSFCANTMQCRTPRWNKTWPRSTLENVTRNTCRLNVLYVNAGVSQISLIESLNAEVEISSSPTHPHIPSKSCCTSNDQSFPTTWSRAAVILSFLGVPGGVCCLSLVQLKSRKRVFVYRFVCS